MTRGAEARESEAGNQGGPPVTLVQGNLAFDRLAASYVRALEAAGCPVFAHDTRGREKLLAFWLRSRLGQRLSLSSLRLRQRGSRIWNREFVQRAEKADLVVVIKAELLMPDAISALRERGQTVCVVHPDDPFPERSNHRPELLPNARAASGNFIWSRQLKARLEDAGAQNVTYLPFAWDPVVFPHVEARAGKRTNVVFVGGWDRHRERWLEPVAEHFGLEIWGPRYWATRTRRGSPLRGCWQGRALRGREAAEVVAGAAISLNVFREQNLPDGTNMRTFEVPGAGGFPLSHRSEGATEIYPEGEAGAYFDTVDEMLGQLEYFLTHVEERRAIAREAHEITAREHRYVHRARRILSTLGLT